MKARSIVCGAQNAELDGSILKRNWLEHFSFSAIGSEYEVYIMLDARIAKDNRNGMKTFDPNLILKWSAGSSGKGF